MPDSERNKRLNRQIDQGVRQQQQQQVAGASRGVGSSSQQGGGEGLTQLSPEELQLRHQSAIDELRSIAEELTRRLRA